MRTEKFARRCCVVAIPTAASLAFAAGEVMPAPNATVTATKTSNAVPVFRMDAFQADDIVVPPSHPPIDQIPPLPMPNPEWDIPDNLGGPGNALFYDQTTGQITEIPIQPSNSGLTGEVGGSSYVGADGFDSLADLYGPRGFGTMSALTDAEISTFPFRMNVKLVNEYIDAGTGAASYFVCSGGMQDAEVVLTAGHCVYKRDNDSTGSDFGFADRVWIYPGWDGNGLTLGNPDVLQYYGWGVSSGLGTFTGWSVDGNFDWDMGLVRITRAVGMLTGWYGWAWGGDCTTNFYNNPSYPAEPCGSGSLHTGRDMYNWNGNFDSCPGNQMHINTSPGCFTALWGGMSGSNAYYFVGNTRVAHGVASNSNRTTSGNYAKMWESFKNYMEDTFKPSARGSALDLQSLQTRYAESVVTAGDQLTGGTAQIPNPTNNDPGSDTYGITVYLSTNNNISTSDTNIGAGSYTWDYAPMQNLTLNMFNVTVPIGTPSGTYWVGVYLNDGQDADNSNNDPDLWDAHQITVNGVADPVANSATAPSGTFFHGDTIGVGYNVTNQGGDPSNAVTVDVYASTNTIISTFDTLLGSFNIGTFSGQQTKSGTLNVNLPSTLMGDYYIGYIISASDDVNNGNNTAVDATALTVDGRADLEAVDFTSLESVVSLGSGLDVQFTVVNTGTIASGVYDVDVYASTNTIISTFDTLLGTFNRPSLGVGGTSTVNGTVTVPLFMAPGNYFIGMIVEGGANENNLSDNSAFDPDTVQIVDCIVDFNNDGLLDLADIVAFVNAFQGHIPAADLNNDGVWDLSDIVAFVNAFMAGCP